MRFLSNLSPSYHEACQLDHLSLLRLIENRVWSEEWKEAESNSQPIRALSQRSTSVESER